MRRLLLAARVVRTITDLLTNAAGAKCSPASWVAADENPLVVRV